MVQNWFWSLLLFYSYIRVCKRLQRPYFTHALQIIGAAKAALLMPMLIAIQKLVAISLEMVSLFLITSTAVVLLLRLTRDGRINCLYNTETNSRIVWHWRGTQRFLGVSSTFLWHPSIFTQECLYSKFQ